MKQIHFVVPYAAIGKGRPRAVRTTTSVRMVTPANTRAFEDRVKQVAAGAMMGFAPFTGPVHLDLLIGVEQPRQPAESCKALDGTLYPATKPDLDNTEKAVSDALNGI